MVFEQQKTWQSAPRLLQIARVSVVRKPCVFPTETTHTIKLVFFGRPICGEFYGLNGRTGEATPQERRPVFPCVFLCLSVSVCVCLCLYVSTYRLSYQYVYNIYV